MTDDLDTLSDAELSEAFAVEVAGFVRLDCDLYDVGGYRGTGARERSDGVWITNGVPFATSADAVLPWLEKCAGVITHFWPKSDYWSRHAPKWDVWVEFNEKELGPEWEQYAGHHGSAPTFPRAACIALIRAHRAQK